MYLTRGVNVANISSYTGRAANVVETQGRNQGVVLEQKGEWLADPSTSAEDSDLRLTRGGRREATRIGKGTSC